MDVTRMHQLCADLPGARPDNPWDHDHPVFKVGPGERGKIFAFLGATGVGVKAGATREVADEWLHIGRSGWNDLSFRGAIPDDELVEAVEESYRLVVSKLPRRDRPDGWDRVSGGAASS